MLGLRESGCGDRQILKCHGYGGRFAMKIAIRACMFSWKSGSTSVADVAPLIITFTRVLVVYLLVLDVSIYKLYHLTERLAERCYISMV